MKKGALRALFVLQALLIGLFLTFAQAADWQPVSTLSGHTKAITAIAFAPGTPLGLQGLIATASDDQTIKLWYPRSGELVRTLEGHAAPPRGLAFSPDGKTLASFAKIARKEDDKTSVPSGEIKVWDVATGAAQTYTLADGSIDSLLFASDGKTLVLSGNQTENKKSQYILQKRDASTGAVLKTLFDKSPWSVSPDGRIAAGVFPTGAKNDKGFPVFAPSFWNLETDALTPLAAKIPHTPKAFGFSPDGKVFITAGDPNYGDPATFSHTLAMWDVASGALLRTLAAGNPISGNNVIAFSFSPDGHWLATADGRIQFWDLRTSDLVFRLSAPRKANGQGGGLSRPAFSSTGKLLATATSDNSVLIWDTALLQPLGAQASPDPQDLPLTPNAPGLRVFHGPSDPPRAVAWAPVGKLIVTANGGTLNFWNSLNGAWLRSRAGTGAIKAMRFSPDGKLLATGGEDNAVRLWDVSTAGDLGILGYHDWAVNDVAFSPDGKLLASCSSRIGKTFGVVRLWDTQALKPLKMLTETSERVQTVAFSPDGKWLVNGNVDGVLEAWDIPKVLAAPDVIEPLYVDRTRMAPPRYGGNPEFRSEGHMTGDNGGNIGLAFGRDNSLASLDTNSNVRLFQLTGTGFKLLSEAGGVATRDPQSTPHGLAISPDGNTLALSFGGYQPDHPGAVKLWDFKKNALLQELKIAAGPVYGASWAPDSKSLASVGGDGALRIWKLR